MGFLKRVLVAVTTLTFCSYTNTMPVNMDEIEKAAAGLLFLSESDHPLEVVKLEATAALPQALVSLSEQPGEAVIETQTLEYFFRNMVRTDPEASTGGNQTAQRFITLEAVLKAKLTDIIVYRIGSVQVDAFIIGKLPDGTYAGLRTKLIET